MLEINFNPNTCQYNISSSEGIVIYFRYYTQNNTGYITYTVNSEALFIQDELSIKDKVEAFVKQVSNGSSCCGTKIINFIWKKIDSFQILTNFHRQINYWYIKSNPDLMSTLELPMLSYPNVTSLIITEIQKISCPELQYRKCQYYFLSGQSLTKEETAYIAEMLQTLCDSGHRS